MARWQWKSRPCGAASTTSAYCGSSKRCSSLCATASEMSSVTSPCCCPSCSSPKSASSILRACAIAARLAGVLGSRASCSLSNEGWRGLLGLLGCIATARRRCSSERAIGMALQSHGDDDGQTPPHRCEGTGERGSQGCGGTAPDQPADGPTLSPGGGFRAPLVVKPP
jgi:hypothetical protein